MADLHRQILNAFRPLEEIGGVIGRRPFGSATEIRLRFNYNRLQKSANTCILKFCSEGFNKKNTKCKIFTTILQDGLTFVNRTRTLLNVNDTLT